jgi:hypothetical protein
MLIPSKALRTCCLHQKLQQADYSSLLQTYVQLHLAAAAVVMDSCEVQVPVICAYAAITGLLGLSKAHRRHAL